MYLVTLIGELSNIPSPSQLGLWRWAVVRLVFGCLALGGKFECAMGEWELISGDTTSAFINLNLQIKQYVLSQSEVGIK